MAPQFVKPYVKTNKNDAADAEAICEAVTRPTMRFVPVKHVVHILSKAVPVAGDAGRALENIVDAWKQYKITAEVEQTIRESIRATRDVNIKMIDENAAILKAYLAGMFKERAEIIEGMFEWLDQGLAAGDAQVASDAMAAIVAVTKQFPLAGTEL